MPQNTGTTPIPAEYDPVFDAIRGVLKEEWSLLAPEVITDMATGVLTKLFDQGLLAEPPRCNFGAGTEASWCGEYAPLGGNLCAKHLDWWKR